MVKLHNLIHRLTHRPKPLQPPSHLTLFSLTLTLLLLTTVFEAHSNGTTYRLTHPSLLLTDAISALTVIPRGLGLLQPMISSNVDINLHHDDPEEQFIEYMFGEDGDLSGVIREAEEEQGSTETVYVNRNPSRIRYVGDLKDVDVKWKGVNQAHESGRARWSQWGWGLGVQEDVEKE
ncbi:hypothetical protein EX30DRAFT_337211 [Ascodesmis nigricans]|uniref:Uncharacterized protein n=1 Tax=Ascodesmis nigricans TaxID=341454 RepID=A0A4S2N5Z7_9PEZI|nr:hypothetical protein EX30DRAFT_337211 [Ascodesmis nigricans]